MTEVSDLLTRWDASIASMRTLADDIVGTVAPPPSSSTLNPSDKSADIILSSDKLTATRAPGNGWALVRGTVGKSAGKWSFQYTQGARVNNGMVGIANAAAPLDNHIGFDKNGVGYSYADGQMYINSAGSNAGPGAYGTGDIVTVEVDLDAKTIAFSVNGGPFTSHSLSLLNAGPFFPAVCIHGGDGSGSVSFGGTPPAGFSLWQ